MRGSCCWCDTCSQWHVLLTITPDITGIIHDRTPVKFDASKTCYKFKTFPVTDTAFVSAHVCPSDWNIGVRKIWQEILFSYRVEKICLEWRLYLIWGSATTEWKYWMLQSDRRWRIWLSLFRMTIGFETRGRRRGKTKINMLECQPTAQASGSVSVCAFSFIVKNSVKELD